MSLLVIKHTLLNSFIVFCVILFCQRNSSLFTLKNFRILLPANWVHTRASICWWVEVNITTAKLATTVAAIFKHNNLLRWIRLGANQFATSSKYYRALSSVQECRLVAVVNKHEWRSSKERECIQPSRASVYP